MWALELSQQCENFFGKIVLQFVGCLLSGSVVGLTHHTSQVCWSQSPCSCSRPLLTCASAGDTQTLKGRSGLVSVGIPGGYKVLFEHSEHLGWVWGLILNTILPLLLFCWGFSFALGCWVYFLVGSNILLSMAVQQQVVILEFSQEKMSASASTLPSPSATLQTLRTAILLCYSYRNWDNSIHIINI